MPAAVAYNEDPRQIFTLWIPPADPIIIDWVYIKLSEFFSLTIQSKNALRCFNMHYTQIKSSYININFVCADQIIIYEKSLI